MNNPDNKSTLLIGEIGQNHNGSVDIAKLIIDLAARKVRDELFDLTLPGLDAVKLTKRDLTQELSEEQARRPYTGQNSFGKTYLEHREFLELSNAEHFDVYQYAKSKGLIFVETLCAIGCLSMLELFSPDFLKVASRDLTNEPLLDALAATKIPMIISTGMAGKEELNAAMEVITKHHDEVSILHCVSQYPTDPRNVNLRSMDYLRSNYPNHKIGYSDHTIGISAPVAAVAMGAEIIEKHITLDRRMKGSDQAGSLGPDGVQRMVRDIRLTELAIGTEEIFIAPGIEETRKKLERSIATRKELKAGAVITEEDICLLSPGDGYKWSERDHVLGKKAKETLSEGVIIYPTSIE